MNQKRWFQSMRFQERYQESYLDPGSLLLLTTGLTPHSIPRSGEIGNWMHSHSYERESTRNDTALALHSGNPKEESSITHTVVVIRRIAFEVS